MSELLTNKDHFLKFGFCVVRNLFDDKEIEKYRYEINEICEKKGTTYAQDLYNYRKIWNYILNDRKGSDYKIDNNNKSTVDEFFNLLKKNNIYSPVPQKREYIEGASISKSERY